jgi:hypothetical protein
VCAGSQTQPAEFATVILTIYALSAREDAPLKNKMLRDVLAEFVVPMCVASALFGLVAFWPFTH